MSLYLIFFKRKCHSTQCYHSENIYTKSNYIFVTRKKLKDWLNANATKHAHQTQQQPYRPPTTTVTTMKTSNMQHQSSCWQHGVSSTTLTLLSPPR